tara:strand:- start:6193 stop:8319 length:2127 start_codon:yes stop_codon:yes gene_type:complete
MAIRKTIEIDVNAKSAIKSLEELGGSFEDANGEGAIPLSTTIGELEDRLYAMSAAGDTASKEFKEIAGQVGKMKKVIIDTDLTLDGMSQNLAQNVGGALTGVASGFSLAQGAMGAFGGGSEAVEESLLKVQSAMAMAQGLQGLKEGVASFKALKSAIMASTVVQSVLNVVMSLNPIGLIVLAVAALAAGIALLWSPIKKLGQLFGLVAEETETAAESNDKLNASIEKQTALMEANRQKSKQVYDDRMRLLALNDATEKEMHEANLDRLKEVEDERQKDMKSTISVIRKKRKRYRMAAKEGEVELAREIKKEIQDNKKKLNTLKSQRKNYNLSVKEANKEFNAGIAADNAQEIADEAALRATNISNYKAYLDKKLAAERRIEDLKNGLIKDDEEKALAIRNAKFARDIEDLKTTGKLGNETKKLLEEQLQLDLAEIRKKGIDKEKQEEEALKAFKKAADEQFAMDKEAFEEKLYQDGLSKDAAEIQAVESKYFNLIALAEQYGLDTVALKEKETAELEAISKASADKQTALDKDVKDSKVAIAQNGLQLVSDLAGMFADRSEKAAKIAFNVQKAASIAQATISGIEATINAFKTASASPITVGFPAFPFIQAGLAGAFAAANIAKIASSKFGGGGSGGGVGNVSAPSGAGGVGGGGNAASFNVVGNTGVNQLAEGLGNQNQQPIQAFVVGSEVTTQQSLDRNKIETATI